jgi:LuxR family transcriptional regulator, quorum-sensing system regulator BjaR1
MVESLDRDVREAFQAIDELGRLTTPESIVARLADYLSRYGFTSFLMTGLPSQQQRVEPHILLNGWTDGWLDRYVKASHYLHDPCVRHCFATIEPFVWSEIPAQLLETKKAQQVMDEAKEFGHAEGLCVPLHDVYGSQAVVTMAGRHVELPPGARRMVHLASLYAYGAAERTLRTSGYAALGQEGRLTERERDVVRWMAEGKTFWEISVILGITESTVNDHMRKIRQKLGTRNAAHTVTEAIRRREIRH